MMVIFLSSKFVHSIFLVEELKHRLMLKNKELQLRDEELSVKNKQITILEELRKNETLEFEKLSTPINNFTLIYLNLIR